LLAGVYPFIGKDRYQVRENILNKELTFDGPQWDGISEDAKDFIEQALERDQDLRPSAQRLLRHSWIRNRESLIT
jgi:calcium-dependent protein kinase